jgi:hypothetical protein
MRQMRRSTYPYQLHYVVIIDFVLVWAVQSHMERMEKVASCASVCSNLGPLHGRDVRANPFHVAELNYLAIINLFNLIFRLSNITPYLSHNSINNSVIVKCSLQFRNASRTGTMRDKISRVRVLISCSTPKEVRWATTEVTMWRHRFSLQQGPRNILVQK